MKGNFVHLHHRHQILGTLLCVTMLILTLGPIETETAHAQALNPRPVGPILPLNRVAYAAKFVCGFKPGLTPPQGRVLNGPGVFSYRDFEPGSYATALNILYAGITPATTTVTILASVPETSENRSLRGINVGSEQLSGFNSVKVDCEDIARALNGPLPQVANQEIIEGFLYVTRPTDDLIVEAVYSHSSQIGSLGGEPRNQGGIGVGSSIHVQNIEPKSYGAQPPRVFNGTIVERAP